MLEFWCVHAQGCVCALVLCFFLHCARGIFFLDPHCVYKRRSFSDHPLKTNKALQSSEGETGWSRLCLWMETLYPPFTLTSHPTSCPPVLLHIQSSPVMPAVNGHTQTCPQLPVTGGEGVSSTSSPVTPHRRKSFRFLWCPADR